MKVYLKKDVEKVGLTGEIIKVADGFGRNFIIARGYGVEVNEANEQFYKTKARTVEHRKDVIESQTSILADKIKHLKITLKRKMHANGKLYGALSASDIVDALQAHAISIAKSQVIVKKSIKEKGAHAVTIKLTARLQPELMITVLPE
jgi:large subunit ribosomal protein L9